jgi:hypothetical protein
LPTLNQALAVVQSQGTTKKAIYGVSVGGQETQKGRLFIMSEPKAKALKKSNSTDSSQSSEEMSRPQALAISWTGLEALAKRKQLIIFNDKTTGRVWFGIANAKVVSVGNDKQGNSIYDLIDTEELSTLEALATPESKEP